jgi:hypothetical protein
MLNRFVLHNILRNADAGGEGGGGATTNPPAKTVIDGTEEVDSSGPDTLPPVPANGLKEKVPISIEAKAAQLALDRKAANKTSNAPTAEELKEPVGSVDDMDDKGIVTETVAEKKVKEDKAEADRVAKETATKTATKTADDDAKAKGGRDYSIFSAEEQALVKTAPNALFNHLKDVLPKLRTENATLKTELDNAKKGIVKVPDSWNEHPEAYVLTPEYRQYRQAHAMVSEEESHWLEQLENVENGRAWAGIDGRDDAGNLVKTKEIADNSVRSKDYINQQLQAARGYKTQFAAKVGDLKTNHQKNYQESVNTIREGVKAHCPWTTNDKLLATEIEFENPETKKLEKASIGDTIKAAYNILPPVFRSHPLAEVFANTFVVNAIAQQKLRLLESQVKVKNTNATHQLEAEPVGATKGNPKPATKKEDKQIPSTTDMDE